MASERHDPARISDATREAAFRLILDGVRSDTPEWRAMRARILDESRVPRLRTRAEVDAEIVRHSRDNYDTEVLERDGYTVLARLLREPLAPDPSEPNRVTDHDADQRPPSYGPSSVDSSSPSEPAAGATSPDACSCDESERLHGYMKDIKFLHRQWSDEKAMAGAILTQIDNVVLRWMSNLP